jgi:GYF domain 2
MRDEWYYAEGEKPVGPLSFDALVALLRKISNAGEVNVWHTGLHEWHAAKDVPQIADLLYLRPPPIPHQIRTSPAKAQPAGGDANNEQKKPRARIARLISLAIIAALVLLVAAFIVGPINTQKLLDGLAARARDPTRIDKALEQDPSNVFLQLTAAASKASLETDRLTQKLLDEIEASVLDKDIDFATASRAELEVIHRDLKMAEANATTAMPRYIALLRDEREKVEALAKTLHFDDRKVRELLSGIDERHAISTAFTSKMFLARAQLYRSLGRALDIVIEQFGSFNVQTNGQFVFATQIIGDRYTAAANEINAAAKHVSELENEGQQLSQAQQEEWGRFVSGK